MKIILYLFFKLMITQQNTIFSMEYDSINKHGIKIETNQNTNMNEDDQKIDNNITSFIFANDIDQTNPLKNLVDSIRNDRKSNE